VDNRSFLQAQLPRALFASLCFKEKLMSNEQYLLSLWAETPSGERLYPYKGVSGPKKGLYSVSYSGKSSEYVGVSEKDLIAAVEAGRFSERGTIRMLPLKTRPGAQRNGFAPTHYKGKPIKHREVQLRSKTKPLFPDEVPAGSTYAEGAARYVLVNGYERSSEARDACIKHYGAICAACDIDFGRVYGEIGNGFIHVHHLVPISEIGAEYQVDPIKDLIPVCPNCHAMIHRTEPPLAIADLKSLIKKA
jgi:hypothetical protein